tara:strand:- start:8783 stop:9610 length:828 start_codon:yes stop_codon:yes gene_type:complete
MLGNNRTVILTSNRPRHKHLIHKSLSSKYLDVVDIIIEPKIKKRSYKEIYKSNEVMQEWLKNYEIEEKNIFSEEIRNFKFNEIKSGELNTGEILEKLKKTKPDILLVFGTGLIKKELIDIIPIILNLHLGLSPFYRGTATTIWPFINKQPEYNGATILKLDEGIDSGPILKLVLAEYEKFEGSQNIHRINNILNKKAIEVIIQEAESIAKGKKLITIKQNLSLGKLYKNKDFKPHHIIEANNYMKSEFEKSFLNNYKMIKSNLISLLKRNGLPYC